MYRYSFIAHNKIPIVNGLWTADLKSQLVKGLEYPEYLSNNSSKEKREKFSSFVSDMVGFRVVCLYPFAVFRG